MESFANLGSVFSETIRSVVQSEIASHVTVRQIPAQTTMLTEKYGIVVINSGYGSTLISNGFGSTHLSPKELEDQLDQLPKPFLIYDMLDGTPNDRRLILCAKGESPRKLTAKDDFDSRTQSYWLVLEVLNQIVAGSAFTFTFDRVPRGLRDLSPANRDKIVSVVNRFLKSKLSNSVMRFRRRASSRDASVTSEHIVQLNVPVLVLAPAGAPSGVTELLDKT